MIAFALALAAVLDPVLVGVAELEVSGPFEHVVLISGSALTVLHGPLAAGESRRVDVPFVGWERTAAPPQHEAEHAVRFLGWSEDDREERWRALPRGLRGRPTPTSAGFFPRTRTGGLVTLVAAGLAVLLVRRRSRAVLAIGAVAATVLGMPFVVSLPASAVFVLEGDAASGTWVRVEARRGECAVDSRTLLAVALDRPSRGALETSIDLAEPERWTLRAPGRQWIAWRAGPAGGELTASENRLGDLDRVWVRSAGGFFEARGPWPEGTALPPLRASDPPPGWLAAGSPPGAGVLLARFADPAGEAGWVRLVGFTTESR